MLGRGPITENFTVVGPDGNRIAVYASFDKASEFIRTKMNEFTTEMKQPSDGDTIEWIYRDGKVRYTIVTLKPVLRKDWNDRTEAQKAPYV